MGFLVNKPASAVKGASTTLTLSNAAQDAMASLVTNDTYMADKSNWKRVVFYYFSGLQKIPVIFDLSSKTGAFKASPRARLGAWQLYKIEIDDYDNGKFVIMREDMASATDDDLTVVAS